MEGTFVSHETLGHLLYNFKPGPEVAEKKSQAWIFEASGLRSVETSHPAGLRSFIQEGSKPVLP